MRRVLRRGIRRVPVENFEFSRELLVEETSWKFGSIFVKYKDSEASLVYNGDTFEFIPRKQRVVFGQCSPNEHTSLPKFSATKDTDALMRNGTLTTIGVQVQCYTDINSSFEEMREKHYKMATPSVDNSPDDIDSCVEQIPLQPIAYPEFNFKKSNEVVLDLLQVKKRYIMFVATRLDETIAQQSKKMDKLCSNVQFLESRSSNNRPLNSACSSEVDVVTKNQSESKRDANVCVSHDCDPCIYCSLENNIFTTLKEQQKCLTVSLRISERMANVFNDLCELMSPNHAIGKRLRKALLVELRYEIQLSSQIIKMQTLYASNLSKMQKLLWALCDSERSTDLHLNGKESKNRESAMNDLIDHHVVSDEKSVDTNCTMTSSSESLKKSSCPLSNHFIKPQGFSNLSRYLDVFLKCSKTLVSLELAITHLLYDLLEEEESSVPKSLENILKISDEIFTKKSVVLKHHRNPYGNELYLAKTADRLRASYSMKRATILIPDGEGTLYTVDDRVIYQGGWKRGKMHGYGTAIVTCTKNTFEKTFGEYAGNWKSNARHGFGHMVFTDGSVYDGEWEMDEIQGRGALRRFDGCTLEGYWSAGNPHGCITFTWPHGSLEYREYKNGDILRVFNPGQDLSSSIKTIRSIENAIEEKTYYKNCVRSLRDEVSTLKVHYEKRENQQVVEERAEKVEIVNSLRTALDESQKQATQKVEELSRRLDCQICMNRPKDCLLLPCLHFNFCTICIEQLKMKDPSSLKCPTCRRLTHGEIHCRFS